jgi:hypothetical protein
MLRQMRDAAKLGKSNAASRPKMAGDLRWAHLPIAGSIGMPAVARASCPCVWVKHCYVLMIFAK